MIITLAGRRTDQEGTPIVRFPLERNAAVQECIHTFLKEQQATALVSAAACGADLLALAAAGELGIRRRIILPFAPERFRAASVMDRPGEWGALFDQIIVEVQAAGDLVLFNAEKEDQATFLWTNEMILDEAQKLARQEVSETGEPLQNALLAVIVWEGQPHSEDDVTAHFANEARARSIPVTEILTLQPDYEKARRRQLKNIPSPIEMVFIVFLMLSTPHQETVGEMRNRRNVYDRVPGTTDRHLYLKPERSAFLRVGFCPNEGPEGVHRLLREAFPAWTTAL